MSKRKRGPQALGFLGGSFDPFHSGHLQILQTLQQAGWPEQLYVIPAWQAPLKDNPLFSPQQRLQQLQAVQQETGDLFEILTLELERGKVSYTWETVTTLRERFPEDELWWIIGGDQFAQLNRWARIDWLVQQIGFLVYPRPGFPLDKHPEIPGLRWRAIDAVEVDVASTQIREAIQAGQSIREWVPPSVRKVVEEVSSVKDPTEKNTTGIG